MLSVQQMARECDRLEEFYRQRDLPGEPGIQLFLYRSCRGQIARVLPGKPSLRGGVVYWGSRDDPSVVTVTVADVRAWLQGLFHHIPDGLEKALGKCAMRLRADRVGPALKSVLRQACEGVEGDDQDTQDGNGEP